MYYGQFSKEEEFEIYLVEELEELQEKWGHTGTVYINIYETDKSYGGPEEGGWWYDSNNPISSVRCEGKSVEYVRKLRKMLEDNYDYLNEGDISSVLGGTQLTCYFQPNPPTMPTKPHYE